MMKTINDSCWILATTFVVQGRTRLLHGLWLGLPLCLAGLGRFHYGSTMAQKWNNVDLDGFI